VTINGARIKGSLRDTDPDHNSPPELEKLFAEFASL